MGKKTKPLILYFILVIVSALVVQKYVKEADHDTTMFVTFYLILILVGGVVNVTLFLKDSDKK